MKKLLITTMLLTSLFVSAKTPEFFAGCEYYTSNSFKIEGSLVVDGRAYKGSSSYNGGELNLIIGIRYSPIDKLTLELRTDTYTNHVTLSRYRPINAEYRASARYDLTKKIGLSISHCCFHPIETDGQKLVKKYGGYTKVGLYYNLK